MSPLRCENIRCLGSGVSASGQGVIEDFSATFQSGQLTGFCGSDTSGKELLLGLLSMIERPEDGRLLVHGREVLKMPDAISAKVRDTSFGYLFTHPHLLPSFTVAENVAMPFLRIRGEGDYQERTLAALEFAGVASFHSVPVEELDDTAHWRVAFARAIVHSPPVLIAVSPPSPLLLPLARRLADQIGTAVLWNGEKVDLLPFADNLIEMTRHTAFPTLS